MVDGVWRQPAYADVWPDRSSHMAATIWDAHTKAALTMRR